MSNDVLARVEATACLPELVARLQQRDQQQRFQALVPPVRFTPVNPYADGTLTPAQLNMRRKFEVLRHRHSATVDAGQTAQQRWAALVRAGQRGGRRLTPASNLGYTECDLEPTPVSSADVPLGGDTDVLVLDPAVPVYLAEDPLLDRNYTAFANVVPAPLERYYTAGAVTVLAGPGFDAAALPHPAAWATMRFTEGIRRATYALAVSAPLALYLSGDAAQYANAAAPLRTVTVQRTLAIFYNATQVATVALAPVVLALTYLQSGSEAAATQEWSIVVYLGAAAGTVPALNVAPNAVFSARVLCAVQLSAAFSSAVVRGAVRANVDPGLADTNTQPSFVSWAFTGPAPVRPIAPGSVALIE